MIGTRASTRRSFPEAMSRTPTPSATIDAARQATLIIVLRAMSRIPFRMSFRHCGRGHAVTDHVYAAGGAILLVEFPALRRIGVGEAAQRQLKRAYLTRECEYLGLARGQLQSRRLTDDDALTVLFFDSLINREHLDVLQDGAEKE